MPEENAGGGDLVTCPTCKKIWPKGTKFCTQCGTWIESGEVMEPGKPAGQPTVGPSPPGIGPKPPTVGPSPPGIGPKPPTVGPSPPGIGPKPPAVGPSPPGIGPTQPTPPSPGGALGQRHVGSAPPGIGHAQPGIGPQAPGKAPPGAGGPGDVPVAPVAKPDDIPPEGAPKKKYSFKVEPQRQEHVPTSATFVGRTQEKKKRKSPVLQTIIVIVCLIGIAFAVISLAFKPLYHFILGTAYNLAGNEETALKYYSRSADKGNSMAAKALAKLGRKGFAKHLELQYYNSWTAKSTIKIAASSGEITLTSSISSTAPGEVTETISRENGPQIGARTLGPNGYAFEIQGLIQRRQISAERHATQISESTGIDADKLFSEDGKADVLDAFFDDLGMRLLTTENEGDEAAYVFEVDLEGDAGRMRKVGGLVGPFIPWSSITTRSQIGQITFAIRMSDGFLERVTYHDTGGALIVEQTFSDFEAGGS